MFLGVSVPLFCSAFLLSLISLASFHNNNNNNNNNNCICLYILIRKVSGHTVYIYNRKSEFNFIASAPFDSLLLQCSYVPQLHLHWWHENSCVFLCPSSLEKGSLVHIAPACVEGPTTLGLMYSLSLHIPSYCWTCFQFSEICFKNT
jgi:hypothetical protein